MAEKRINPFLYGGAVLAVLCLSLVMCSEKDSSYQAMKTVPDFEQKTKARDGDTQADTIKALQAYAKEAVKKADQLNQSTRHQLKSMSDTQQKVHSLEQGRHELSKQLRTTRKDIKTLTVGVVALKRQLFALEKSRATRRAKKPSDLPVGFGFDDGGDIVPLETQGRWHESLSSVALLNGSLSSGQTARQKKNLLPQWDVASSKDAKRKLGGKIKGKPNSENSIPVYTLPKDSTLTDGVALTALIGRIPVDGQTPDPYPVKIYVGKENLLANGHDMPEIEGMIFSGLGFGDWNLNCVSARLSSATYLFADGTIVNHSSDGEPLGYISDPSGIPCIAGKFITNAPAFLSQRTGLATLGAAGSAFAEAQQTRQTSSISGGSSSTVTGSINKLAAGQAVQSATEEVSRWLLARQKQSFDAVVVDPGVSVSIHLNQSLPFDYSLLSRRVRYASDTVFDHHDLD